MPSAVRVIDRFQDLSDVDFSGFTSDGLLPVWDQAAGKVKASAVKVVGNDLLLPSAAVLQWGTDVKLVREAAGLLAMRNGVNAQTVHLYNTYTDANNYERLVLGWSSNVAQIGAGAAGTGVARRIDVIGGPLRLTGGDNKQLEFGANGFASMWLDGGNNWVFQNNNGPLYFSVTSTSRMIFGNQALYLENDNLADLGRAAQRWRDLFLKQMVEFTEMTEPAAPAADKARLYVKDNGAGKSQLAVRFATGAVQVLATEP